MTAKTLWWLPALTGLVLCVPAPAKSQIVLQNKFVKTFFAPTGDMIGDVVFPTPYKGSISDLPPSNGILYRPQAVSSPNDFQPLQDELIAIGTRTYEGWFVDVGGDEQPNGGEGVTTHVLAVDGLSGVFTTAGIPVGTQNSDTLRVVQMFTMTDTGFEQDKRLRVDVTLELVSSDPNATLSNVAYVRTVNPRQGLLPSPGTLALHLGIDGSAYIQNGMAVISSKLSSPDPSNTNERILALATDVVGARVSGVGDAATNTLSLLDGSGYYEWDGTSPQLVGLDPLSSGSQPALNLWFDSNVFGTLRANTPSPVSTFYYVFAGGGIAPTEPGGGNGVPEPGSIVFGMSAFGAAMLPMLRRRARRA